MAIYYSRRRKRRGLRTLATGILFITIGGGIASIIYYVGSYPIGTLSGYQEPTKIVKVIPVRQIEEEKIVVEPSAVEKQPLVIPVTPIKKQYSGGMPPEVDESQPIKIKVVLNLEHPDQMRKIPAGFKLQSLESCPVDYEVKENYVLIGGVLAIHLHEQKLIPTIKTAASSATEVSLQSLNRIKIAADREAREVLALYNVLNNEREQLKLALEKPGPKPWASVKIAQGRVQELDKIIPIQETACKNWLIELQKINECIKLFQELNGKMQIQLVKE